MNTDQLIEIITAHRHKIAPKRSLLVAISGIDGSEKSTLAGRIVERLERVGIKAALIGVDVWHNPPKKRFGKNARPNTLMLLVSFDASLFQPVWSGTLEYRFNLDDAPQYLEKIQQQTEKP